MTTRTAQSGFTLLEVLIAFALIVFVIFAAVLTQSDAYMSSGRNRNIIVATHLARNLINKEELAIEGKSLDHLEEKKSGNFEENKDFKWTIEYSKVDFSALTELILKKSQKDNEKNPNAGTEQQQLTMVMRVFKDYLEKSVRRMTVTIEWPDGKGTSQQTFSQLLVDYDQEFNIAI